MKSPSLEEDGIYTIVGIAFCLYILYSVIYSFTDSEQVKSNAKLAVKECGVFGVKSVSVVGFICQSANKT
jgi:hypothetical protein